MAKGLIDKLFGDRGYVSQPLFEQLYAQGLEIIARRHKNMKNRLVKMVDKILLRKRAMIESVNDQLKNICQVEHSRHRSRFNFLVKLYQISKFRLQIQLLQYISIPRLKQ
jgi:hypothetical protein